MLGYAARKVHRDRRRVGAVIKRIRTRAAVDGTCKCDRVRQSKGIAIRATGEGFEVGGDEGIGTHIFNGCRLNGEGCGRVHASQ